MKLNVKLTADELMNVVDAAMNEAMEQELYFDNFGNENVKEILAVVDAALTAMGIEIVEDDDGDDDDNWVAYDDDGEWGDAEDSAPWYGDEDEYDEDEKEDNDPIADMLYVLDDGRTAIKEENAYSLLDMIRAVGKKRGLSDEQADSAAHMILLQIGEDYGIDVIEKDADEEAEEKPEESNLSDTEKRFAKQVFIKISATYPNLPLEVRADMAANIAAKVIAEQRAKDGE